MNVFSMYGDRGGLLDVTECLCCITAELPAEVTPSSGKCPDRVHISPSGGQNAGNFGFQTTEEPRRTELGVKRTHSDEPSPTVSGSPNPFTVAVTRRSARLRGPETKMAESFRSRLAEPPAEVTPSSGKCPDRVHIRPSGGQNAGNFGFQKTEEEPWRTELGVKRTHSDDLSALSSGSGSVKRPTLDSSRPSRVVGTLWIPPVGHSMVEVDERSSFRRYFGVVDHSWSSGVPLWLMNLHMKF
ncbi:uncharacterized protein [Pyxicephalus adspersus]|uniref:uncharacterized protein n=1 Tax=Pyxicephalus adspersus TaxID=30357 RepID=UPI003B59965B